TWWFFHTLVPSRVTVPLEGARNPAIRWRSVDLPAPLGPSRPVTPGPIVMVTSLTATTLPYQRETWESSILTARPPSGSARTGQPRRRRRGPARPASAPGRRGR